MSEKIERKIIDMILSGKFRKNGSIKESYIAKFLGTSQAPVREALKALESKGIIEYKPYSGRYIKEFDVKYILSLYEVRKMFNLFVIENYFENVRSNINLLIFYFNKMLQCIKNNDYVKYAKEDTKFHRTIIESCDNEIIVELWDLLEIRRIVLFTMQKTSLTVEEAVNLHEPIIKWLRKGELDKSKEAIKNHYDFIVNNYYNNI